MNTNFATLVDVVIKAETDGKPRHELILEVGETPECLLKLGFKPLKIAVKAKNIGKMFFDHGLTVGLIKRAPELLVAPKAIFKSAAQEGSVVVLTYEVKGPSPIILVVAKDIQLGRRTEPLVNELKSMYDKQGPDPVAKWTRDGLLLWEHKTK